MRVLAKDINSDYQSGCDRIFDPDGPDILVQLRPATPNDHHAIAPDYVPSGEVLGRISRTVFLDAARSLGLK